MTLIALPELGRIVRARRLELGATQAALAAAAGVSRFTLIKLERGQLQDINFMTVLAVLRSLRLTLTVSEVGPVGLPIFGEGASRRSDR